MQNIDEFFRQSYYNNLRILLTVCGIWPFQGLRKRYAMYVGCSVLFGFTIMLQVWPDFFEVFDCLTMLFYTLTSTIKLIYSVYKLPKIKMLLVNIREHWCSPKSDGEAKILRSHVQFARKFGYIYSGGLFIYAIIYAFTPLVVKFYYKNTLNKTQDAEVSSDHHISYLLDLQMQHIPFFIQGASAEIYLTVLLFSFNVLYLMCVQHCCGLFEALKYHLENGFEFRNNDNDIMTTSMQNKCYSNIAYGVRRHIEAVQFATAIESLYRLPFFMHMTINVSLLSIVGAQVINDTENISRLMPYGTYLSGLILNTFFENWQGQKILDCNEKVYNAAYNLEWYKMPIMSQKLLIMIMMRSKKPVTITAGKVLVLSYVTFNSAMRTAFSYLMILRSVN